MISTADVEVDQDALLKQMDEIGLARFRLILRAYEALSELRDIIETFKTQDEDAREDAERIGWLKEYDDQTGMHTLHDVIAAFLPLVHDFVEEDPTNSLRISEGDTALRSDILRGNVGLIVGEGVSTTEIGEALKALGGVLVHGDRGKAIRDQGVTR